jgi:hypothetical protein
MRQWIRSHLTYANVVATLSLFLVVGGGTALGAYVISSNSQVGPGTISGHKPPTGKHANIIAGSINGQDIADRSGVDTCQGPLTAKYGPICAGSDGGARAWQAAANYCAGYGLRLPSYSEAHALAVNYDVPGVSDQVLDGFWTDDYWKNSDGEFAEIVNEAGNRDYDGIASSDKTVCVTDPSA